MKYLILFFSLIFSFLINTNLISAQEIYFEAKNEIQLEEVFEVSVFLDTNKEFINAVDLEIYFNNELLEFQGYVEDKTLIKNWITSPYSKENKIYLSGIFPGGINGLYDAKNQKINSLQLVTLLFKAKKEGNASFVFIQNTILKNDGLGTVLDVFKKDINLNINNIVNNNFFDNNPPKKFEINLIKTDENIEFVSLNAIDDESGIKEFRIKKWNRWVVAENPYQIKSNLFSKNLKFRAYDFSSNYKEEIIYVEGILSLNNFLIFLFFISLAGFFVHKLLK